MDFVRSSWTARSSGRRRYMVLDLMKSPLEAVAAGAA
jgi:hypothetical protein